MAMAMMAGFTLCTGVVLGLVSDELHGKFEVQVAFLGLAVAFLVLFACFY